MYRRTQEELKIECVAEYLWFQSPSFRCQRLTFKSETHNKQAVFLLNEKTENYIVNKLSFYGMRRLIINSFQLFITAQHLFSPPNIAITVSFSCSMLLLGCLLILNIVNKPSFY